MESITSRLTKAPFGSTAANLHSLFHGRKFLKLLKSQKDNGGSGSARDTSQRRQQARTTSWSFCLCQISIYFPV